MAAGKAMAGSTAATARKKAIENKLGPTSSAPAGSTTTTPKTTVPSTTVPQRLSWGPRRPGTVNPYAQPFFDQMKQEHPGVVFAGIWGDEAHKKRKSDHNTGDAVDISFGKDMRTGQAMLAEALKDPNTKYAILGRTIYYPDGRTGTSPYDHSTHLHVSFLSNAQPGNTGQRTNQQQEDPTGLGSTFLALRDFMHTAFGQAMTQVATQGGYDPNSVMITPSGIFARKASNG